MKEGWNDAHETLPPIGQVCEVMPESDVESQSPPARATLVRTLNDGYVWANGNGDRPEFRYYGVRYWRLAAS